MTAYRLSPGLVPLRVQRSWLSGMRIVSVEGEADAAEVKEIAAEMLEGLAEAEDLVLDLIACDFIDSAVLAAILVAHRQITENRGRFALVVRPGSQPMRVLQITGIYGRIPVVNSLEAAIEGARGGAATGNGKVLPTYDPTYGDGEVALNNAGVTEDVLEPLDP
jgi:anti-anti-sigma factor